MDWLVKEAGGVVRYSDVFYEKTLECPLAFCRISGDKGPQIGDEMIVFNISSNSLVIQPDGLGVRADKSGPIMPLLDSELASRGQVSAVVTQDKWGIDIVQWDRPYWRSKAVPVKANEAFGMDIWTSSEDEPPRRKKRRPLPKKEQAPNPLDASRAQRKLLG